jgi:hypothetical protein
MAKILAVVITWSLKSPLKMIAFALNVVKMMTLNILTFATPEVALTLISAAITRLQTAYNNRKNGESAKLEFDNACIALDLLLHQEALYVNGIAKGNDVTILLSGYLVTKNGQTKKNKTDAPGAVGTKTPGGGVMKMLLGKVTDASSYIYVIFLAAVGQIIVGTNTVRTTTDSIIVTNGKLRETVTGLPIGVTVTICALTQNSGGISPAGPSSTQLIN